DGDGRQSRVERVLDVDGGLTAYFGRHTRRTLPILSAVRRLAMEGPAAREAWSWRVPPGPSGPGARRRHEPIHPSPPGANRGADRPAGPRGPPGARTRRGRSRPPRPGGRPAGGAAD